MVSEHRGHPMQAATAQGLARFSLFRSLFTTINSITLNLVKAFRIYFFPTSQL